MVSGFFSANCLVRKFSLIFTALLVCLFFQSAKTQTPTPAKTAEISTLELNKPLEGEFARLEKHSFQLTLTENQFASVTVEQRGIDVAVRLFGPDKKVVVQSDLTLKTEGLEKIEFVAVAAGTYRIEIEAKPMSSAKGSYSILLAQLRESTEKERRLEEARKLHFQSIELYGAGKYDDALKLGERSLEIREMESGAENIDVAASLANLSLIFHEQGDYEKAILFGGRALNIREKVLGFYHQDVARTLHNLARTQNAVNNYQAALQNYQKAIEIREKVLGLENADLATSLNSLGLVYENLGDYEKAEQLIARALEIKEKTLPPTSPSIATSLSNLAGIFSDKGDEDKALELYQRALLIREKAYGPDHPEVARSLEYLATSYLEKGDYSQAETNFLRALSILQKAFGEEHYRIARVIGSLAILYQRQGNYAKAEPLFRQTSAMMEKTVGADHSDFAAALYNEAGFYTEKGNYQKAEPLYNQAVAIAEKLFGSQHPDLIGYLNGLAVNFQAQGNSTEAIKLWSRAHQISEHHTQRILLINSERQKLLYLDSLTGETNQYLSAHLKFAPDSSIARNLALTTIFERKGRVLDAMAFDLATLRNRFDKDDQFLLDQLRTVTSQLSQKILGGTENTTVEAHEKEIQALETQKEKLEIEMSRKNNEFRSQTQPVTISSIQSAIPENAALIEFSTYQPFDPQAAGEKKKFGEPRYVAYIIRREGEIQWKDLGETKAIDTDLEAFRQSLRDPKRNDVQQLSRTLDEKLMSPIRPLLGNAVQLLISPDGNLNLIPFEALVDQKNHYLIENYSFTYLTSGRDLLRLQTNRESKSKPLLVANPSFGEPPSEKVARLETVKIALRNRHSITATRSLSDTYFAPLGGTAEEARSIQSIFPEAESLTGIKATENAIKQSVAPKILHIATHGFFLQSNEIASKLNAKIENPLLRSGLALAGANQQPGAGDDGILTALEVAGMNLWGTKLVVLSACDTGLGEVKIGEGVYGLRRAFVLAGTESLVMSLWSVSDYVTREMMTGYYKNLKQGLGRGEALRRVQLEMLKNPTRQHPFYWAGFIQSGEWANLEGKR